MEYSVGLPDAISYTVVVVPLEEDESSEGIRDANTWFGLPATKRLSKGLPGANSYLGLDVAVEYSVGLPDAKS
jgi:hypothetical protein